jgi:Cu+-exporting ATPase
MMVRDPVCGMSLEADQALHLDYRGKLYHFCSHDCKINFEDRPDEYVHPTHHLLGTIITSPLEVLTTALRAGETQTKV